MKYIFLFSFLFASNFALAHGLDEKLAILELLPLNAGTHQSIVLGTNADTGTECALNVKYSVNADGRPFYEINQSSENPSSKLLEKNYISPQFPKNVKSNDSNKLKLKDSDLGEEKILLATIKDSTLNVVLSFKPYSAKIKRVLNCNYDLSTLSAQPEVTSCNHIKTISTVATCDFKENVGSPYYALTSATVKVNEIKMEYCYPGKTVTHLLGHEVVNSSFNYKGKNGSIEQGTWGLDVPLNLDAVSVNSEDTISTSNVYSSQNMKTFVYNKNTNSLKIHNKTSPELGEGIKTRSFHANFTCQNTNL